jgi:hypothetical protein
LLTVARPPVELAEAAVRRHERDAGGETVAFDGADITKVPDRGTFSRAAGSR